MKRPEAPTPTSEPLACYTLDLVVADGEGTLEATTPQNCDGGYWLAQLLRSTQPPYKEFSILEWSGTDDDTQTSEIVFINMRFQPRI